MIVFKEGNKVITQVKTGRTIVYHNRILIDPPMFIEEGKDVMIFTDKNVDEFQKHFTDQLKETLLDSLKTKESYIEHIKLTIKKINELKTENNNLKRLNKQLSETIIQLK
ncbi:hypothetical protein [Methanobacterium formicicum]|uniref:Uncharacterized protein n=1 Tax=Methanobacterium formicicum (strain DSM 3637 / PP1) TaxID=1204725 RepID=K2QFM5_METFP|nr:hypothetical protein [Methanobacterium formicicum]EKF86846.1 hypothetical protein A994_01130 [Methanobacterium formicicum DSM 3637]